MLRFSGIKYDNGDLDKYIQDIACKNFLNVDLQSNLKLLAENSDILYTFNYKISISNDEIVLKNVKCYQNRNCGNEVEKKLEYVSLRDFDGLGRRRRLDSYTKYVEICTPFGLSVNDENRIVSVNNILYEGDKLIPKEYIVNKPSSKTFLLNITELKRITDSKEYNLTITYYRDKPNKNEFIYNEPDYKIKYKFNKDGNLLFNLNIFDSSSISDIEFSDIGSMYIYIGDDESYKFVLSSFDFINLFYTKGFFEMKVSNELHAFLPDNATFKSIKLVIYNQLNKRKNLNRYYFTNICDLNAYCKISNIINDNKLSSVLNLREDSQFYSVEFIEDCMDKGKRLKTFEEFIDLDRAYYNQSYQFAPNCCMDTDYISLKINNNLNPIIENVINDDYNVFVDGLKIPFSNCDRNWKEIIESFLENYDASDGSVLLEKVYKGQDDEMFVERVITKDMLNHDSSNDLKIVFNIDDNYFLNEILQINEIRKEYLEFIKNEDNKDKTFNISIDSTIVKNYFFLVYQKVNDNMFYSLSNRKNLEFILNLSNDSNRELSSANIAVSFKDSDYTLLEKMIGNRIRLYLKKDHNYHRIVSFDIDQTIFKNNIIPLERENTASNIDDNYWSTVYLNGKILTSNGTYLKPCVEGYDDYYIEEGIPLYKKACNSLIVKRKLDFLPLENNDSKVFIEYYKNKYEWRYDGNDEDIRKFPRMVDFKGKELIKSTESNSYNFLKLEFDGLDINRYNSEIYINRRRVYPNRIFNYHEQPNVILISGIPDGFNIDNCDIIVIQRFEYKNRLEFKIDEKSDLYVNLENNTGKTLIGYLTYINKYRKTDNTFSSPLDCDSFNIYDKYYPNVLELSFITRKKLESREQTDSNFTKYNNESFVIDANINLLNRYDDYNNFINGEIFPLPFLEKIEQPEFLNKTEIRKD